MYEYKIIDLTAYPRRAHLEYFLSMKSPHLTVTAEVDVTELREFCKRKQCSFYLAFLHVVALSADGIPQLRQRLHRLTAEELACAEHADAPKEGPFAGLEIREYLESPTSSTESTGGDLYGYLTLRHHMPWEEYIAVAAERQQAVRKSGSLEEDPEIEAFYFPTCLPWIHYTDCVHPTGDRFDSNPRFSWGKYEENFRGRLMMPLTVLAHHGLVDGIQLGRFYESVERNMAALTEGNLEYGFGR